MAQDYFNIQEGGFAASGFLTGSEMNGTSFLQASMSISSSDVYRVVFAGTLEYTSPVIENDNSFGFYINSASGSHSVREVKNLVDVQHSYGRPPSANPKNKVTFHIEDILNLSASDVISVFASGSERQELRVVSASLLIDNHSAYWSSGSVGLDLQVTKDIQITGTLDVSGVSSLIGDTTVGGDVTVGGASGSTGDGVVYAVTGSFQLLEKAAGTFKIPHPDPELTNDKYLVHSFVESPTAGDNIYRYSVNVKSKKSLMKLPSYFKFLNEKSQVWINPVDMLSLCSAKVSENMKTVEILVDKLGTYNILVIGTRKDEIAKYSWTGPERDRIIV